VKKVIEKFYGDNKPAFEVVGGVVSCDWTYAECTSLESLD